MRRIILGMALLASLVSTVVWWRRHRRTGSRFVNNTVNPFLLRHGVAGRTRGNLGMLEHIGRRSGVRRVAMVHPVPTDDGFRIIVPLGEESQWARNVLAAGHCRLQVGDTVYELDEPALVEPGKVPELPALFRWVQGELGFRWFRLHQFAAAPGTLEATAASAEPAPIAEPRGVAAPTPQLVSSEA
jgi:deazaflavin-dependent oxidoreductase (nitroreductase family)